MNFRLQSDMDELCDLYRMSLNYEDEMGRACSTNGGEEECI
jgi:hypothetical protein